MTDDGVAQQPGSLEVEVDSPVKLSWTVSNAPDGVELTEDGAGSPQTFASDTTDTTVTPDAGTHDYDLVAISGSKRSPSKRVHISTHAAGDVVSPHANVNAPTLEVEWTFADADGKPIDGQKCSVTAQDGTSVEGDIVNGLFKMSVPIGVLIVAIDGHFLTLIDVEEDGADASGDGNSGAGAGSGSNS